MSPGTYEVRVSYLGSKDSALVVVHPDPRIPYSASAEEARQEAYITWQKFVETATTAADRIRDAQTAIERISDIIKHRDDDAAADVRTAGKAMTDSLKSLLELFAHPEVQGIGSESSNIAAKLNAAESYLNVVGRPPGQGYEIALSHAVNDLTEALEKVNTFFGLDWNAFRLKVEDAQLSLFEDYAPILLK